MKAFSMLRKVKQKHDENVQLYAKQMLTLARDTFKGQDAMQVAVEQQLIGFVVDGLCHNYLRIKVMRENPSTFEYTVISTLKEQKIPMVGCWLC